MNGEFEIKWIDRNREPQCSPNPAFPSGIAIDASCGENITCSTELPYPAKRCGFYIVKCKICGFSVAITTAGRPDDPVSIVVPCNKLQGEKQ